MIEIMILDSLTFLGQMRRKSYTRNLTESQALGSILRSLSEGKNEDQIAGRFGGGTELVKTLVDAYK